MTRDEIIREIVNHVVSGTARRHYNTALCDDAIRTALADLRLVSQTINEMKELILARLHHAEGICMTCGKKKCLHEGNTALPEKLDCNAVLRAINLNEHFFKENEEPK